MGRETSCAHAAASKCGLAEGSAAADRLLALILSLWWHVRAHGGRALCGAGHRQAQSERGTQ
jgi:hypothetical protein